MPEPTLASDISALFQPVTIAGLALRNRIVMAPMTRRKAPADRVPDDAIARYYTRRARHGVGLILTEGTHIEPKHAPDSEHVPGIWNDAQVDGWRRVTDAVHDAQGLIGCQLWHTGRIAMDPIAPSAIPALDREGKPRTTPRAMTEDDIHTLVDQFAHAASCAQRAGFDTVEIHGAHGYILHSFMDPEANHRDDAYGGDFERRMTVPIMVTRAVRAAVGDGYPILYRFSQFRVDSREALPYPDPEHLRRFTSALADTGVDVLHASVRDMTEPAFDQSPRTLAGWTRDLSGLPTIAVGGATLGAWTGNDLAQPHDPAPLARMIERGEADLIAVGRALIANPDWCEKVRAGDWHTLRPYSGDLLDTLEDEGFADE
ncbi:MAG: NADH:flavin oxidoreductase [Phycisphaerales bacterium]